MLVEIATLELVGEQEFRQRFPDTSFPPVLENAAISDFGYLVVEETESPGEFYEPGDVVIVDGHATRGWVPMEVTPALLNQVFKECQDTNRMRFEEALAGLTSDYPQGEIQSWERQREEVLAWAADNNTPTPWIDLAAVSRGLERTEYLNRTLSKVNLFAPLSAMLIGHRQKVDDELVAAKAVGTVEAIRAVPISYAGVLPF